MEFPRTIRIDKSMAQYCEGSIRGEVEYTRTDIAQSLADALERLCSAVTDIRGIDMNTYAETELTQARAALANYRKGE